MLSKEELIIKAIQSCNLNFVKQLLQDVDRRKSLITDSVLHEALKSDDSVILDYLVKELNLLYKKGTPDFLRRAISMHSPKLVNLLLVNYLSVDPITVIKAIKTKNINVINSVIKKSEYNSKFLLQAISTNSVEVVKTVKIYINVPTSLVLRKAVESRNIDIIKLFFKGGSKLALLQFVRVELLTCAVETNNVLILEQVLKSLKNEQKNVPESLILLIVKRGDLAQLELVLEKYRPRLQWTRLIVKAIKCKSLGALEIILTILPNHLHLLYLTRTVVQVAIESKDLDILDYIIKVAGKHHFTISSNLHEALRTQNIQVINKVIEASTCLNIDKDTLSMSLFLGNKEIIRKFISVLGTKKIVDYLYYVKCGQSYINNKELMNLLNNLDFETLAFFINTELLDYIQKRVKSDRLSKAINIYNSRIQGLVLDKIRQYTCD